MRTVFVEGWHVVEEGPPGGEPLLLLHALGTDARLWDAQARVLGRMFRVVRCDFPGHGMSASAEGRLTLAGLADGAARALDGVGIASAHVAGASLGARVALEFAARHPGRTRSLAACFTGGASPPPPGRDAFVAAVRERGMEAAHRLLPDLVRAPEGPGGRRVAAMQRGTDPRDFLAALAMLDEPPELSRVAAPATVVAAERDALVPVQAARALAQRLPPGARFALLRGCAHLPHDEDAAALTAALLEHLLPAGTPAAEAGMAVRRAVLGEAHVARSEAALTPLDRPFRDFILEGAWGRVWTRPGLSRRDRSLVTLAILAALGHEGEFRLHVRAMANTGATEEELAEALLHVATYAGVPAANHALKIAKEALTP